MCAATITAGAVALAACGSSTPAAVTSTSAGSGGTTGSGGTAATAPSGGSSGLDVAKLGTLTNYTGTMTDNGASIAVTVHSPTNWQESLGTIPTFHIDGASYVKSINAQGQPVWYKNADPPTAYQQSPYPGAVQQFVGFTKVAGATIVRGASCTVAGTGGHLWTITSPRNPVLREGESACVADQSGALLSLNTTGGGSAAPASGLSYSFTMTTVGSVPPFAVPAPVAAG